MIFGKWNPIGAMLSSLLFGLFTSLAVVGGQIPGIKEIPSSFLQMAPYVFTIIVLALLEKQLRLRLMVLTTSNLNKFTKIKKSVDEQTFLLYF